MSIRRQMGPMDKQQKGEAVTAMTNNFTESTQSTQSTGGTPQSNKQRVYELLKSIETGDPAPIAYINPNKYIQHNLAAADGLAGFRALMQQLPPNSARVNTVRVF